MILHFFLSFDVQQYIVAGNLKFALQLQITSIIIFFLTFAEYFHLSYVKTITYSG